LPFQHPMPGEEREKKRERGDESDFVLAVRTTWNLERKGGIARRRKRRKPGYHYKPCQTPAFLPRGCERGEIKERKGLGKKKYNRQSRRFQINSGAIRGKGKEGGRKKKEKKAPPVIARKNKEGTWERKGESRNLRMNFLSPAVKIPRAGSEGRKGERR